MLVLEEIARSKRIKPLQKSSTFLAEDTKNFSDSSGLSKPCGGGRSGGSSDRFGNQNSNGMGKCSNPTR